MDPYAINMMLGTSMATHIFRLLASTIAHMHDPYFEFHNVTARARGLLRPLPTMAHLSRV